MSQYYLTKSWKRNKSTTEFEELDIEMADIASMKESLMKTKLSKACLEELGMSVDYSEEWEQLKLDIKRGIEERWSYTAWRAESEAEIQSLKESSLQGVQLHGNRLRISPQKDNKALSEPFAPTVDVDLDYPHGWLQFWCIIWPFQWFVGRFSDKVSFR